MTRGWYINTTYDEESSMEPKTTGDSAGLFLDGSCACVSGSRANLDKSYTNLYFIDDGGKPFTSLSIKLISASWDTLALPTIYLWPKSGAAAFCRGISAEPKDGQPSQLDRLKSGETLTISYTEFHNSGNGADCSTGPHDMPPGEPIRQVSLQVDGYERQGRHDFNFCVLSLTVNP